MTESAHVTGSRSRMEQRRVAESLFKAKAHERGLEVLLAKKKRAETAILLVNGNVCKLLRAETVQTKGNQRRIYTKINFATLKKARFVIFVSLVPEVYGKVFVVPSQDILEAFSTAQSKTIQLMFPLHTQTGTRKRTCDWWQYEDRWDLFTAPQQ